MLFYPTRRGTAPGRHGSPRPISTGEAGDAMHLTWMLKSFVMGITLLGLSYWLVQIAGVQYLASLTSATLLAFLLAYVVWCLLHKNRHSRQTSVAANRMEAGNNVVGTTNTLTPTPPPPFERHEAYKFNTIAPPRDCSPPPSYEEAIRVMMAMSAGSPGLTYPVVSPESQPGSPISNAAPPTLPPGLILRPTAVSTRPTFSVLTLPLQSSSPPTPTSALTSTPSSALTSTPSPALAPASVIITTPTSALSSSSTTTPVLASTPPPALTTTSSLTSTLPASDLIPSSILPQSPTSNQKSSYSTSTPSEYPEVSQLQSYNLVTPTPLVPTQFSPNMAVKSSISTAAQSPTLTSSSTLTPSQSSTTTLTSNNNLTTSPTSVLMPTAFKRPVQSSFIQNQNSTQTQMTQSAEIQPSTSPQISTTSVVTKPEHHTPVSSPTSLPTPKSRPSPPPPPPFLTHFDMGNI